MIRRVVSGVRLFLAVQYRTGFIHVYLGVTVFTVAAVRWLLPEAWREPIVPVLLLTEYGVVGLYMIAAQSYLAQNEKSNEALWVTPLRDGERTAASIVAMALIAIAAATLFVVGLLGADARWAFLLVPLGASTVLAGSIGLIMASHYPEFTRFIMGSIPVVSVFCLPLLSYFDVVPRYTFVWLPWDAALFTYAAVVSSEIHFATYALFSAELLAFAWLAFHWAVRAEASS